MTSMLDSDWSRQKLLRSDWLRPIGAPITTALSNVQLIQFYNCKELNRALEVFSVFERDWFLKILREAYTALPPRRTDYRIGPVLEFFPVV